AALDIAGFAQALVERAQLACPPVGRCAAKKTDHRHRALLRARRQRPRGHRAAEQGEERASLHSINSSASNCTALGPAASIALAGCRLMTNSYLVDCTTGNSAGLAPLRMRPV